MIYFIDSSAVLNGALSLYDHNHIYLSPLVLIELENLKTNGNEHIKYQAREAIREIINSNITMTTFSQQKIEKILKKNKCLMNINDHRIICEALILINYNEIIFVTSDCAQLLFAKTLKLKTFYFVNDADQKQEEYNGWKKYHPTEDEMVLLYSNLKTNVLNAKINEYCEIFEGEELKDVLFWDGEKYRNLNYKEFKDSLGEKIKPRNLEQKMYFDLLQNKNIPIKLCIARFGTGKSFLALSYALHEIQQGRFDKIIFVKNNLEVKGAGTLGTLPGDEIAKQYPWLRQIEDHIGIQKFEEYLETGIIEPAHLSTLRGRDLKNSIILVDEAENLLPTNIQLLLGRVAENSEIIFCADIKQCDYKNEKMSGIPKMIERLAGNKLFGMVKLLKTERSAVAATADLLD